MLSSSFAAGIVVGSALLLIGPVTGKVDINIEASRSDALWLIGGLPLVALVLFVALSPLSFCIHRLLAQSPHDEQPGSGGDIGTGNV